MKRVLTSIVLTAAMLLVASRTFAASDASVSATPNPLPSGVSEQQLETIKDRLATKVAELRHLEPMAIYGTVKDKSLTSATVETDTKDVKIELTDSIKVIEVIRGARTTLTLDDLSNKDTVTVFGSYDQTLDVLSASVIFLQGALPVHADGVITDIDKTNNTLTVRSPDGQSTVIDIETDTKTNTWTKDGGITKSGFSKVAVGDTLQIIATPEPKYQNRVSARRILDLGNLTSPTPTPRSTGEATPSSVTVSPTP
ncbi:hypothetical protein M1555_04940 [Patescibacteria group bacterium]|nr:hypothetical protein [Patescibacteria group bacterium]